MEALALKPGARRGDTTREALLDAAEHLIAEVGFRAPTHRMIARQAGTHVALVNYHFSSKEMLFEAAVERRAARLTELWRNALNTVRLQPSPSVDDIIAAWWRPFSELKVDECKSWTDYLCVIARLASAVDGEAWHKRYFGAIDEAFHEALLAAMPGTAREDVEAGFRYARSLFGEVLLHRCEKTGGARRPRGFREDDIGRLIRYVGDGLRGLQRKVLSNAA